MKSTSRLARVVPCLLAPLLTLGMLTPSAHAATETLTVYCDAEGNDALLLTALVKGFQKSNPNIKTVLTIAPPNVDTKAMVKSSLIAGTMQDVFSYYSGSLFQSLDPALNLTELTKESWQSTILSSFYPAVSIGPKVFGAPLGSATGGGILYNKVIYRELGLRIPLTWPQFMRNNAIIKKAGIVPVIQTYKDPWTSQLLVLADYFNVTVAFPDFAALYTIHRAVNADTPAALVGFQHLEDMYKSGYLNKDFATATFAQGLKYLATGLGAHYPMLTFASTDLAKKYPDQASNIGFFAQPGPSAERNGLTVWMPSALFIPKRVKNLENAKKFIAYSVSPEGMAVINAAFTPTGPFLVKNVKLSRAVSTITRDMLPYFESEGRTVPALEFLSPIKGPNLPGITVRVGSGKISALSGARAYDDDVARESVQLGLPGWGKLPQ